jgi:hypothetical protein
MQPAHIDLTIYKGSTFSKNFQWKTGTPAVPVDLTGCTLKMQVRKNVMDTNVLAEFSSTNGLLTVTNAAQGRIALEIPASTSTAFTFMAGVYDIEITFVGTGDVYRIIEGCFSAIPEVTK